MVSWLIGLMTTFHNVTCLIFQHLFSLNSFLFSVEKNKYFQTRPSQQMTINCKYSIMGQSVFISFISRGMQFGADQSSEVQWLSSMVLSSAIQGSAVWWSQAQTKTVQSSEVQCRPVQSSEVLSGSVQSSPVQSTPLTCGPVHSVKSAPVQSNSNSFPSS